MTYPTPDTNTPETTPPDDVEALVAEAEAHSAMAVDTVGEILRDTETPAVTAVLDGIADKALDTAAAGGPDEGAENVLIGAEAQPAAAATPAKRRNFKKHPSQPTEEAARALVAGMAAGSFYKKKPNPYAAAESWEVYEAV